MAKHRNNPNFAFWKMLKEGYDHFNATHQEPKVAVCEKRYVFDPTAPDDSTKPLSFNAQGKCPVYQLDKNVADAVLDRRRQEQFKMAEYIAKGVSTVPPRNGVDGGMNPVFASKLVIGTNGQVYLADGNTAVPGALPRTPSPLAAPAASAEAPIRSEQPAPPPKKGEPPQPQPTSIAGLFANLSRSQARAQPSAEPVALRGTNTEIAARPKRADPVRTVLAPTEPHPRPHEAAPPKLDDAMASNAPAPAPALPVQPARDDQKTPAPRPSTAYSAPPPIDSGLLTGAQPVVPASSFESRWVGLR